MVKALIKKQFAELGAFFYKGKDGSRGRTRGFYIFILSLLFVSFAMMFFGLSYMLAEQLVGGENEWLYFSSIGLLAISFGAFGGVFTTYATLYTAKDNELLVSMPIRPSLILLSRMITVYVMAFYWTAAAWLPAMLMYYFFLGTTVTALKIIFPFVFLFLVPLVVAFITSILGFIIAAIAPRVKFKTLVAVIISLAFFGGYMYVSFQLSNLITKFIDNIDKVGTILRSYIFPLYELGLGASGNPLAFLISVAMIIAVFALLYWILSMTFLKITMLTTPKEGKSKVAKNSRESNIKMALFKREAQRFFTSYTYILNCGFGILLGAILVVVIPLQKENIINGLNHFSGDAPFITGILPYLLIDVMGFVSGLCIIAAPSISLEGKYIWLLKTSPIEAKDILRAKELLHIVFTVPLTIVYTIVCGIFLGLNVPEIVLSCIFLILFNVLNAKFCLFIGMKKANLNWINESVVVKQGAPIIISILCVFGFISTVLSIGIICLIFANFYIFFAIACVMTLPGIIVLEMWQRKGAIRDFLELDAQ